jgi:spermidine/putrescine transport system ATP-binding protein
VTVADDGFIELRSVSRSFGDVVAVNDVSLSLRRGEFISLLGPSGCGKTTTLRMLAGFERPDRGTIELNGEDIVDVPAHRRPVNTVFQSYALFTHMSVYDNVAFGLRERGVARREVRPAVEEAIELVRLQGMERRKPRELSGGQQQRVALARAIVNAPQLLLLDEPLGALDLKLRRAMQVELKAVQRRLGMTFLYVTHDQEEAFTMSDRIAVMEHGEIVQLGAPEEIYERPVSLYVADFVGEANILSGVVAETGPEGATIELDGGDRVGARATPASRGARVRVVVRPEKIDVDGAEAGAGGPALAAVVEESVFLGSNRKLIARLTNGSRLVVTLLNRAGSASPHRVGDSVRVGWSAQDAWVIGES